MNKYLAVTTADPRRLKIVAAMPGSASVLPLNSETNVPHARIFSSILGAAYAAGETVFGAETECFANPIAWADNNDLTTTPYCIITEGDSMPPNAHFFLHCHAASFQFTASCWQAGNGRQSRVRRDIPHRHAERQSPIDRRLLEAVLALYPCSSLYM